MMDNAVLAHAYDVTPEALWNAVKGVLKMTEGVTLEAADDEQMGEPSTIERKTVLRNRFFDYREIAKP